MNPSIPILRRLSAFALICLLPAVACAAPPAADCLARLQALAGDWTGTVTERDTGPAVCVTYRLTAGGSAVVEHLFPGDPHEMMTVYHLDSDRLLLTHYCAMKNQPRMVLDPASTATEFIFTLAGGTNLIPGKGTYMHAGRIRFIDADTSEAEWEVLTDGKPVGQNRFFLKRVKAKA
ncbi:MAG: hypothetical protein PHE83_11795 [Opitutaceae bacterium]|nr:hypothetical protein [Opitutaceae bacterium]